MATEIKVGPKGTLTVPSAASIGEEDAILDRQVKDMMRTQGWTRLCAYYEVAREDLIDKILKASQAADEKSSVMTKIKAAVLKGFEEWRRIPDRLVTRLDEYDKLRADELEEKQIELNGGMENHVQENFDE